MATRIMLGSRRVTVRTGAAEVARMLRTWEAKLKKAVNGQYGYHGAWKASIQLFNRKGQCVIDRDYRCEGWGGGRLVVSGRSR